MVVAMSNKRLTYKDASVYDGDVATSAPHGAGTKQLPAGERYHGQMRHGVFHGRGILVLGDGTRYEGEFQDGKFHGVGVIHKPNALTFKGEFRSGVIDGKGRMIFSNGSTEVRQQEGTFKDGVLVKREHCRDAVSRATKIASDTNNEYQTNS